jgi:hypothetical protein
MRAMYLANYFVAGCIAFSLLGWVASLHPIRLSSSSVFVGSDRDRLGFELAAGFLTEQTAQDFRG